jgi:hypothetical protein
MGHNAAAYSLSAPVLGAGVLPPTMESAVRCLHGPPTYAYASEGFLDAATAVGWVPDTLTGSIIASL